jgi:hypothetical protein
MSLRLLIDECLSPDLVDLAVAAGHVESTCLRDRGLLGTQPVSSASTRLAVWISTHSGELFEIALEELAELPDLINQVLEVTEEASGDVVVTLYELPSITNERPKEPWRGPADV